MVDQQPIQDPMIPNGALQAFTGAQKLELVRESGDRFWEAAHVEEAIRGVMRSVRRRPEFLAAAQEAGLDPQRPPYNEPWSVSFAIGDASYTVSHDEVQRPTKHYHVERVVLERTETGVTNRGSFCSIPAHKDEKPHIFPRAEVVVGEGEPLTGVSALAAMNEAFPELGLVWD